MLNLNIADVTVGSNSLTGDGAFDVFMQACTAHLMKEYTSGRITGDKYAEAYIAMMQSVLQAANQFAVSKVTVSNQSELEAEQKALLVAQTLLTNQKKVTEVAQTNDVIDGVTVAGTVGKQKEVYTAQVKGFKDDALQKATKMFVDTWNVRRTTDTDSAPTDGVNKLEDANIGKAITALGNSVGIPIV